jgi:ABC-2 type transport system ATP-binding protein
MVDTRERLERRASAPDRASEHWRQGLAGEDVVSLQGLTKDFGAVRAVDSLSLAIHPGETVALLGPNGAGKTTTIAMLLGLLAPDSGAASVLGLSPRAAIRGGRIGAMLQEGSLMPGVRVGELLAFALRLRATPIQRQQRRKQLLSAAGLNGLERRRIDRLSGGQLQRVRFALAIASDPDALVLDEPTNAMDVETRRDFWARMREFASAGRAILFATHYLEEAEAFASRVVIISRGRIVADGSVAELKSAIGLRVVRFRVAQGQPQALAQLPHLAEVRRMEVDGERITLKTSDADASVRHLMASGIAWQDLEVRGATLEDVFLALVGNGGNGEPGGNGGAQ